MTKIWESGDWVGPDDDLAVPDFFGSVPDHVTGNHILGFSDGLYNWHPENTRNIVAALARGRAETDNAEVVVIGDSIAKYGPAVEQWAYLLPQSWSMAQAGTGMICTWDDTIETRWVFAGGGWTNGGTFTYRQGTVNGASATLEWPEVLGDTVDVAYFQNSTATFNVTIDGVSKGTVTPSGASTAAKATYTGLGYGPHRIVITQNSAGLLYLVGANIYRANSGMIVHNVAIAGAVAYAWADETNFAYPIPTWEVIIPAPDAWIICVGLNDVNQSRTTAQLKANITSIVTSLKTSTADVILCLEHAANVADGTWQPDYTTIYYEVADEQDIPLVDFYSAFGPQSGAITRGLVAADNQHPSKAGHQRIAAIISGDDPDALDRISRLWPSIDGQVPRASNRGGTNNLIMSDPGLESFVQASRVTQGAATLVSVGWSTAPVITSAVSATNQDNAYGPTVRIASATNGTAATVATAFTICRAAWIPEAQFEGIPWAATVGSMRYWIGLFSATPASSADPASIHAAAFRFDTGSDGTAFWRTYTKDGTTATVKTTTAAHGISTTAAASVYQKFRIEFMGAKGTNPWAVRFWINDVLVSTHTTNLPGGAANNLGVYMGVTPLASAQKNIDLAKVALTY